MDDTTNRSITRSIEVTTTTSRPPDVDNNASNGATKPCYEHYVGNNSTRENNSDKEKE